MGVQPKECTLFCSVSRYVGGNFFFGQNDDTVTSSCRPSGEVVPYHGQRITCLDPHHILRMCDTIHDLLASLPSEANTVVDDGDRSAQSAAPAPQH